ncbi:hypothetical protein KHC23_12920 [Ancylobacter dichloromethanicus]|uniref:hypothetical protein n=1 Tax=Ancylobacter dichloromethanicus TaxID=518825 RepID=UPI001BD15505|nr:hypothetical protein [Ancylobacter dichloromethanicus]MBS7554555.1 hypothetical protein [Ancylobacter dichloromethanicus]
MEKAEPKAPTEEVQNGEELVLEPVVDAELSPQAGDEGRFKNATDQSRKELWWGEPRTAWLTAAASWVSVIFTAIGLSLLYWTLRATREAVREAEKASRAAVEAVDVTRTIGEAQVRAYVTAKDCRLSACAIGAKLRVKIGFINNGATPARSVDVRGSIIFAAFPQAANHPYVLHSLPGNTAGLAPNIPGATEIRRFKIFTAEEHQSLVEGKGAFYVHVVVSYLDVFGRQNISRTTFVYGRREAEEGEKASVARYGNSFEWGRPA